MRYAEMEFGAARLRDGARPETPPGFARVRVLACGVCATDLHLLHGMVLPRGAAYPVRPGHEIAGIVEHVNGDGARVSEGDLAILHPLAPCGQCEACSRGEDQRCDSLRTLGMHDAGGFAEFVAKTYGVSVVGLTISREQREFAERRIFEAGLTDKVEIRFQDYRDERDRYDRIASIEMIEAQKQQCLIEVSLNSRRTLQKKCQIGGRHGVQTDIAQKRK